MLPVRTAAELEALRTRSGELVAAMLTGNSMTCTTPGTQAPEVTVASVLDAMNSARLRQEADIDQCIEHLWQSKGGRGPAPLLYVCPALYAHIAGGWTPGKLRSSAMMADSQAAFFSHESVWSAP